MINIMMIFDNYRFKVVLINTNTLKMSIDEKIISITKDDLDNLFRLLKYFDKKEVSNTIDSIRYSISIDNKEEYSGDSSSNKNFYMLNDWLGDINGR